MSAPAAGTTGVQFYDGTTSVPVVGANKDFSFTSSSTPSTVTNSPLTSLGEFHSAVFFAQLQGNTGGALDIYLQYSPDGGSTWVDYMHFAQLAAAAATIYRTFMISKSGQQTTIATVGVGDGSGGTPGPALSGTTVIGGDWGDRLRVCYVVGASTTLGKAQTIFAWFSRY